MSACPDCCVDELKRIRLVEEGKRKSSKTRTAAARQQQQAVDQQQRQQQHAIEQQQQQQQQQLRQSRQGSVHSFHDDGAPEPARPGQGARRSFHDDGASNEQPSSRRSSQQTAEPSRRRRSTSRSHQRQNSFTSAASSSQQPPPPPKRSSSAAPRSRSLVVTSAGSDVDTASLTEPSSDSSNEADGVKGRSVANHRSQQQQRPSSFHGGSVPSTQEHPSRRKSMYVRQMMHTDRSTDRSTGRTGRYTGRVDENFVPDGEGVLTHDDGSARGGEWRDGRLVSSVPVGAALASHAARRRESSGGGKQRARSGSRTPREPSRDRHNGGHGSQRGTSSGRSRSQSRTVGVRERSTSRSSHHQPHPVYGQ